MAIALPILLLVSWFVFCIQPQGSKAIEDELNNVPDDRRQGTSILPVFPIAPLLIWGGVYVADQAIGPWISQVTFAIHIILLFVAAVSITRNVLKLRAIERDKAEQGVDRKPDNVAS